MPVGRYSDTLRHSGFWPLLITQFLGAFNDNVYLMVVSLLAGDIGVSSGEPSKYVSLVGAIFILPYFFFSGYAGHLADVLNKRLVLVVTKSLEIVVMCLALFAFLSGQIALMIGALFLVALKAAFFSPAKYGILPEIFPDKELSRANGLLEMSTFLAIILGTSIGSVMFAAWRDQLQVIGLVMVLIAIAGTYASLGISIVPPSGAKKPFRLNPWAEISSGIRRLYNERFLWLTVVGISYFWFLGALLKMDMILLGKEVMGIDDLKIGFLLTFLALGIGFGSIAAGRLSGDKVEPGLVPLGSIGMGIVSLLLSSSPSSYPWVSAALILLGFSAGFFIVPLDALLQQRSGREERGQLIGTNNFLNTGGILLASGVFWTMRDLFQIQADRIILILGFFTLAATIYILSILPDFLIRFAMWMLTHTIYKIRIVGEEHVPFRGPALLVCNHLSYVDAFLVGACVQRFIRFLIYRPYYEIRWFRWLFSLMKAIPVSSSRLRELVESLNRAREELRQGHVVCIFPEGAISRSGHLLPFKRGFEKIVDGLEVPIIPVYLDQLWGSIFSFKDGRFFWKWPRRIPYPVTVLFGAPMRSTATAQEIRQAMMELAGEAASHRRTPQHLLHLQFLKVAKRRSFSFCMADSTGRKLTYGRVLLGSVLLMHWLARRCPKDDMIGLMLPASVAGAVANIAVLLAGKVPVNLNWTAGREAVESALRQCGIRTILTSRTFLARAKLEEREGMVFLEEIMQQMGPFDKVWAALLAYLFPSRLLQLLYHPGECNPHALATVIFSSGSTGLPKGIMLSHHNILSNIEGMSQIFSFTNDDRIMGVLPFFHSFGFTGTLWLPLLSGIGVIYHPNPLDARTVGQMTSQYKATILITTPTFCAAYLRRCTAEEFSSLRYTIVGAEKLREPLAAAFKQKYGLELLEGYGCTELAPVVSVNVPDVEEGRERQTGLKLGTVGHPIPGVAVKVVNPDTWAPLPHSHEGLLLVKGPNRMMGYLGQPQKTEEVFKDGWYVTGDIASIDDDGFIRITDRLSRFSKISGEMVPHLNLEEVINQILGSEACVVVAIPDEQKGERLAVLYSHSEITPARLWERLCQTDLPKLWIPKQENLYLIESIPLLGSGKVDLRKAKTIAMERPRESE